MQRTVLRKHGKSTELKTIWLDFREHWWRVVSLCPCMRVSATHLSNKYVSSTYYMHEILVGAAYSAGTKRQPLPSQSSHAVTAASTAQNCQLNGNTYLKFCYVQPCCLLWDVQPCQVPCFHRVSKLLKLFLRSGDGIYSSGRVLVKRTQGPWFNPQYWRKNKYFLTKKGSLTGQNSLLSQAVIPESLRSPRLLCCGGPQVLHILIEPPVQNHSQKRYFQHHIQGHEDILLQQKCMAKMIFRTYLEILMIHVIPVLHYHGNCGMMIQHLAPQGDWLILSTCAQVLGGQSCSFIQLSFTDFC